MSGHSSRSLRRVASRLAGRLADWSVRHASPAQRDWLLAIQSELPEIDTGIAQLRWAAGGAWIVARQSVRRQMGVSADSLDEGEAPASLRVSWAGALIRNAIALALFWCYLTASQWFVISDSGWERQSLLIIGACAAGLTSATWIRAGFMAYLLAGQVAFGIAEIVFHVGFSIQVVQGAPAHFSVMIAGTIAAALTGAARSRTIRELTGRVWHPKDLITSTRNAVAALDERSRVFSTLLVVSLAWAVPELLARAPLAADPFRDSVTDWAIALAALIGSLLGSIIARAVRARQVTPPEIVCASAD